MEARDRRQVWEDRHRSGSWIRGNEPNRFLQEHVHRLPVGRALDVAMGDGRNSVFLAQCGFSVTGLDWSPTAVGKARERAREAGVAIDAQVVDLEQCALPREAFDAVVVTNYLQRDLLGALADALRPGGVLLYETFTVEHVKYREHDPSLLLQPNELLHAFLGLRILFYRDVDLPETSRCVASLIAQKQA